MLSYFFHKRFIFSAIAFFLTMVICINLNLAVSERKFIVHELAKINDVKYGLFNSKNWIMQISSILERRISTFELTDTNRKQISKSVEKLLNKLILEIDNALREERNSGGLLKKIGGIIEQGMQDIFINLDEVRNKIPEYTNSILDELEKPESKEEIKLLITNFLKNLEKNNLPKTEMTKYKQLLVKHDCLEKIKCNKKMKDKIRKINKEISYLSISVISLNLLLLLYCVKSERVRQSITVITLASNSLILLAMGVITPMIEIEAKIEKISIEIYSENIIFNNQVLYFQSKSVLDVILLLIKSDELGLVITALMIFTFSIIFPVLKLISSFIYCYIYPINNNLITFFALKSGKWSMADVMTIAILMAYMGFEGLLSEQLKNLEKTSENLNILTTNGTSIQTGFYMFLSFCILSLFLSFLIEKIKLGSN